MGLAVDPPGSRRTMLSLNDNNLAGPIPSSFLQLGRLRDLWLRGNPLLHRSSPELRSIGGSPCAAACRRASSYT